MLWWSTSAEDYTIQAPAIVAHQWVSHDTFRTLDITRAGTTTRNFGTFVRRTVVAYCQNSNILAKFWLCAMGVRFMDITTLRAEHDARNNSQQSSPMRVRPANLPVRCSMTVQKS